MQKVKIIGVPPGQAPEWVRKEWVGLELPVDDVDTSNRHGTQRGVLGGEPHPDNIGGYAVPTSEALNILKKKSPAAFAWWDENTVLGNRLIFSKAVCELVNA